MERIEAGSQEAAWEMLEVYGPHVQRYIRRSLNPLMRSKFDSVDFAQVVWASFFREPGRIRRLDTPEQLMGYLASMARHKVVGEVRHRMYSDKRDLNREVFIEDSPESEDRALTARDPTPSAVAIARERWTQMLDEQPETVRQIVELRFHGASFVEIAAQLQLNERTVRRAIERLVDMGESDI